MIHYVLAPPATESNKGMHTSGNSSKCAPGLKTQYTQVIKKNKFTSIPCLLIEIRAKHNQPID